MSYRIIAGLFLLSSSLLARAPEGVESQLAALKEAVKSSQSAGDNAWMLMSAALVLMMTGPGLALFYSGLVRKRNVLGTINATLQTLVAAASFGGRVAVAGVILNHPTPTPPDDISLSTNRRELDARCDRPLLAEVAYEAERFEPEVDWFGLAR